MARAQLLRPVDPFKFKSGEWVYVLDTLSGRKRLGVVHTRTEENGDDTIYGIALKVDGGFAIPQWYYQRDMEATEQPPHVLAEWRAVLAQKAKN